jgi:hypothetical protein
VICKVCGDEIHEQMVVCRRCKTPHHLDCWQYTGSCSVFGCRETKYLQPAVGEPLSRPPHAAGQKPDSRADNASR